MKRILVLICYCIAKNLPAQSLPPHTPLDNALWISPASSEDSSGAPCPLFRKEFTVLHPAVEKAILYITAHGVYEARINGLRVGIDYFMPGCTAYDKRLLYQTYDVTDLLKGREQPKRDRRHGWRRVVSRLLWQQGKKE
jgi:alpha-L-rhamnosidase